jgi:dTDP-4-amino-4,6-dideoxygalactose transaminase
MRTVKFGKPIIDQKEQQAVAAVLEDDILVHGPRAKHFEDSFSAFTGAPQAVSCSSCTAALHLSYFHFGIGPGDEVIAPAQSHVATVHAIELVGATPVFVDSEYRTGNIDIDQIESKVTKRTKAITLVHFLGMPVNMDRIMQIADKYNLRVIEDCALAAGSYFKGQHVGFFGDTGCYSFYPIKHFTTAEGGMLTTKDADIAEGIRRKKAFGVDRTAGERKIPGMYDVTMLGFNYRMNEIQAAIGIEQLKKLPDFLRQRKINYERLESGLKELPGIDLFQSTHGDFESSYYCFTILLRKPFVSRRREVIEFLNERGVGTSIYYPQAIPDFTYYRTKYNTDPTTYTVASRISQSSISLPVGPHLNVEDMDYIISVIKESFTDLLRK